MRMIKQSAEMKSDWTGWGAIHVDRPAQEGVSVEVASERRREEKGSHARSRETKGRRWSRRKGGGGAPSRAALEVREERGFRSKCHTSHGWGRVFCCCVAHVLERFLGRLRGKRGAKSEQEFLS